MSMNRSGYTLAEMIVVMVIFGVVTGLSIPRLQGLVSSSGLRSAQMQTASYLAQARAVAVQRGREARFIRDGNSIYVTVDSAGTQVTYARAHDLQREHGVTVSTTTNQIAFDPRGFAIGTSSMEKVRLTRSGLTDSVCVTKLGKVIYRGCAL
jgi:prepilin-type N-terminal cleavage/methylation domain-containing protein